MAVVHSSWLVDLGEARAALSGLDILEDLLSPSVTARVEAIRADPSRARLLVLARLDPADDETWREVLGPPHDEYGLERSAGARLVTLLTSASREAGEFRSPWAIELHLAGAGWDPSTIELCLRGRPLYGLFTSLAPPLSDGVLRCRNQLVGGWLDETTATGLIDGLDRMAATLARIRSDILQILATTTGLNVGAFDATLATLHDDLRSMLSKPDADHALWIIQD